MSNAPILMHAGTSPVVSQTVLTLMLVVLGIILLGAGYGFLSKTKESLLQHRWTLTVAVALTLTAIVLVMLPTTFNFYTDSDAQLLSSLSIVTAIHGILGVPAVVTGAIYVFHDLPRNVKKWMRISIAFWIATIVLGVVMYLQMMTIT